MDLYVERQCVDEMRKGDMRQFMLLYDAYFVGVYKYVARRVSDRSVVEKIVRLTFLDALGQVRNTPNDIGYLMWLYTLAKPRVWENIAKQSFPEKQGLIKKSVAESGVDKADVLGRADKMFKKLSMEEREILRLKFFEEVTDGEVMMVLSAEEATIGPKIYKVLKRAHLLLFGESDEKHGVYFGELSAFFEKLKSGEKIEIPEVFKLSLKADISMRIDRRDFMIEGKVVEEQPKEAPFAVKKEGVGSNDPAKIFVEAVAEMRADEKKKKAEEVVDEDDFDKRERVYDFIDKWKSVLVLVPVLLFIWIVAFVVIKLIPHNSAIIERGYVNNCSIEVGFTGGFSDAEKRSVNAGVSDRLCDHFTVNKLLISRTSEGIVGVNVEIPDWLLNYNFVKKVTEWRIQKYERTANSNNQSGKILRNSVSNGGFAI